MSVQPYGSESGYMNQFVVQKPVQVQNGFSEQNIGPAALMPELIQLQAAYSALGMANKQSETILGLLVNTQA